MKVNKTEMNILILIDELPFQNSGMTLRIIEIFKRLIKNHKIYCIYIGNSEIENYDYRPFKELLVSLNKIQPLNKQEFLGRILNIVMFRHGAYAKHRFKSDYYGINNKINVFIKTNKIDVIHVFGCFTAQYVEQLINVPKIWDIADSYSLEIHRKIKNSSFLKKISLFICKVRLFNYERQMINNFSNTIFVSDKDANIYKNIKAKNKIRVIPNGVDFNFFTNSSFQPEDFPSIIFTGHMSFPPNIDAIKYFTKNVYPYIQKKLGSIKFYVVGADPTNDISSLDRQKGIIVTGKVDDIRPFLEKATVFVNPMISGCGIKNKLLQAMAMKKAIVSTKLGAESVSVSDNENIMIADEPKEFALKTIALLENKELRLTLGKNARKVVEEKYSWEITVRTYLEIYEKLSVVR